MEYAKTLTRGGASPLSSLMGRRVSKIKENHMVGINGDKYKKSTIKST
jgi:hypothetical protein